MADERVAVLPDHLVVIPLGVQVSDDVLLPLRRTGCISGREAAGPAAGCRARAAATAAWVEAYSRYARSTSESTCFSRPESSICVWMTLCSARRMFPWLRFRIGMLTSAPMLQDVALFSSTGALLRKP